jgi:hypothetical protein
MGLVSLTATAAATAAKTAAKAPVRVTLRARSRLRGTVISPSAHPVLGADHPFHVSVDWPDGSAEFPLGAPISAYLNRRIRARHRSLRPVGATGARSELVRAVLSSGCPRPFPVMRSYLAVAWLDDAAVAWASLGYLAPVASDWQELGLRPAEVAGLTGRGGPSGGGEPSGGGGPGGREPTPAQLVAEWSAAGIPAAEIADWLGAGLTLAEACAQRARGVTVQEAAVLRSLRSAA